MKYMIKTIVKRILYCIPTLLIVVIISFLLVRVVPGDPVTMMIGDTATEFERAQARSELGLDQPLLMQFFLYCKDLLHGDLGIAWHTSNTVVSDLMTRLPATLELALWALVIAIIIGIPFGIISAVKKNSAIDHICRIVSMVGSAMPVFWLGLLLIYFFFYILGVCPAPLGRIGMTDYPPVTITGLYVLDSLLVGDFQMAEECASYLVLPAVTLSMPTMAILARMTRSSMLDVLSLDFVRTARAKGLSPFSVVCKHALANALIPILTVLGSQFGVLMGSTVVCETIFSWPGIGSYLTQSILVTDYNPIQAFTLITAVLYLAINLILDIIYTIVDPRIRIS